MKVLRNPSVATFEGILDEPNISAWRSSLWVAAGLLGSILIFSVLLAVILLLISGSLFNFPLSIVKAMLTDIPRNLIMFWVAVITIHTLARMVGGFGTYIEMAFTYAIIYALFQLAAGLLTVLSVLPQPIFQLALVVLTIYALVLAARATCAVNGFGWVKAAVVVIAGSVISMIAPAIILGMFAGGMMMPPV